MTSESRTCRRWAIPPALVAALIAVVGCGAEPVEQAPPAPEPEPAAAAESLEVPFTAEQIRDEWRPGLTLVLHFNYPDRQEWQRWTVLAADADGAEIAYLPLDAQGQPAGMAERAPSSWVDLRDHALFPAAEARRERASRETAFGELEGWLYRVHDPQAESVTEFFFADDLPGAPVWMETRSGEQVILTVNQIARQQLAGEPADGPETAPAPG
jgi:hypothetical protein